MFSGIYESDQLNILKFNIVKNQKCMNLSLITTDPTFLVAAWVRIMSEQESLTSTLINILNGAQLVWFEEIASTIWDGKF